MGFISDYPVLSFILGYAVFVAAVLKLLSNTDDKYERELQIELDKLTIKKEVK